MPLLLCDLDDTLIDRSAAFGRWATAFCAAQRRPELQDWLIEQDDAGYRPREAFVADVCERFDLDAASLTPETFRESFFQLLRAAPGTLGALTSARQAGWRIAVVTNGEAWQLDKVRLAGLTDLVDAVQVCDAQGPRKPDPEALRRAARLAGASLDGAWMVGDNPETDIAAATAAGIRSVWLDAGRPWPPQLTPPTATAASFAEAVDLVLRRP